MTVGKYLKQCREQKALSQAHVARKLGLTCSQFVWNIEHEKAKPSPATISQWCDIVDADKCEVFNLLVDDFANKLEATLGL